MNTEEIECFTKTFITTKTSEDLDSSHLWIKKHNYKNVFRQRGWCYNNRGFISQRYMIENY